MLRRNMDRILSFVCIFLFMFMVVIGSYQIISRYVFNAPSTISEELLTYSFTWMSLLSAAYVFGKRDHMKMAVIANLIKGVPASILGIIIELSILLFSSVILVYGGYAITKQTSTQVTASLGISMGAVYAVLPVCGVLIVLYNILNIKDFLLYWKQGGPPAEAGIEASEETVIDESILAKEGKL